MNKIIVGIVLVVAVLGGLIWLARPKQEAPVLPVAGPESALVAEESQYDFGTISMAAGDVSHQFKIRNTGLEPVNIRKIYTSCMCTTAKLLMNGKSFGPYGMPGHGMIPSLNQEIPAGGEAEMEVIFDPAAHGPAGVGKIERAVIIENDAADPLELLISANVTP